MEISYEEMLKCVRFDDYENIRNYINIIKNGMDLEWKNYSKTFEGDESALEEKAADLQLFEYRMNAMQLCCLIEVWEQDLFNFLYGIAVRENNIELQQKLTFSSNSVMQPDNNYGKKLANAYKFFYGKAISEVSTVEDSRNIVNAIKHGAGQSFAKLKEILGNEILADSNLGYISADGNIERYKQANYDVNTLTSKVLNLDGKIEKAYDEIVTFWRTTYQLEENRLQTTN